MGSSQERGQAQSQHATPRLERKFRYLFEPMSVDQVIQAHAFPESVNNTIRQARQIMSHSNNSSHDANHPGRMEAIKHKVMQEKGIALSDEEDARLTLDIELHDVFKALVTKEHESIPAGLINNFMEGMRAPERAVKIMKRCGVPEQLIKEVAEDIAFHADRPLALINPNVRKNAQPSKTALLLLDLDWADMFSPQRSEEIISQFVHHLDASIVWPQALIGLSVLDKYVRTAKLNFKHFEEITFANMETFREGLEDIIAREYGPLLHRSTKEQWRHILSPDKQRSHILNSPKAPIVSQLISQLRTLPQIVQENAHILRDHLLPFFPEVHRLKLGKMKTEIAEGDLSTSYRLFFAPYDKSTLHSVGSRIGSIPEREIVLVIDNPSKTISALRYSEKTKGRREGAERDIHVSFDSLGMASLVQDERRSIGGAAERTCTYRYTKDSPFTPKSPSNSYSFPVDNYSAVFKQEQLPL